MGRVRFGAPVGVAYHAAGGARDERSTLSTANTDGDHTSESRLLKTPERLLRGDPRGNTSMRGVEVKLVRRKDVDLEKVWDLESATGKGVLYVVNLKATLRR